MRTVWDSTGCMLLVERLSSYGLQKLKRNSNQPFQWVRILAYKSTNGCTDYTVLTLSVIRINHFVGTGWGAGPSRQKRSFEDVILPDETRIKLESLVSDFLKSGRWYSNRGLSWKKGILLHGPPGCGKTSTIVGLASKYDLRIHYLSLNHPHLTDESLAAAMRQVQPKSVVCLEVSDVFHQILLAVNEGKLTGVSSSV